MAAPVNEGNSTADEDFYAILNVRKEVKMYTGMCVIQTYNTEETSQIVNCEVLCESQHDGENLGSISRVNVQYVTCG